MIAYLSGEVLKKEQDFLILQNSGVGYKIFTTEIELQHLSLSSKAELWIFENIKEDRHDLFGFTNQESLQIFEKILSVNGAGPKAALAILNIGPITELKSALINSDAKYIQQASGVGKKLAERLILEISGKLSETALQSSASKLNEEDEAYQALISLGYSPKDASKALEKVDSKLTVEERVKLALTS